jgi:glycosyltransferase involved in cell wall biosynthesis
VISVLLPTRNRPANLRRLLDSAVETADGEVQFVVYVDDDDPTRDETCEILAQHAATRVDGPRVVLSEMWNRCWDEARFDVAMQCGDDIVFRTDGWDSRVLDEFDKFPDRIVFVHGDDGFQGEKIGTHGFLHRRWVQTVGYFVPPYFSSDYNDLWVSEVADALGRRRYLPDVMTEHMHPVAGKGTWDQTHQERLVRHQRDNVDQLYRSLHNERVSDVEKLKAAIADYE